MDRQPPSPINAKGITFTDKGAEKVREFLDSPGRATSRPPACASASAAAAARASSTSSPSTSSATATPSSRTTACSILVDAQSLPYVDGSVDRLRRLAPGRRLPGRQPQRRRGLRLRLVVPRRGRRAGLGGLAGRPRRRARRSRAVVVVLLAVLRRRRRRVARRRPRHRATAAPAPPADAAARRRPRHRA